MFSEEKLAEIRERLPIHEVISDFVQLKKAGKNYKGLCPFHQEKTPSFIVSPERETFHCFGCGTGGNLFHFFMKLENLPFPEAVQRLAERAGVTLEKSGSYNPAAKERREKALEIQRRAAWYYHCLLKKTPVEDPIWAYLTKRQINQAMIETFHLGYCPHHDSGLRQYLESKGFSRPDIEECSLYRGDREFFRGRLMFPIFRADKKVVGLGGRLFAEKETSPKYLNSPESEVFKKGELFYGLHLAKTAIRQNNQALVVEGYLDVITLHSFGFVEAIAPLGTAFTPHHARALRRMCENIILLFDGDRAGEEASIKALEALLGQGSLPHWIPLEGGEDPDSFLRRFGRLAFEKKLMERRNLFEELIDKWSASVPPGPAHLEKKGQTARRALSLIDKIPDPIVKNLYQRRLAEALEVPEQWLKTSIATRPRFEAPRADPKPTRWLPEEEIIFEVWLKFPELRLKIMEELGATDFFSEEAIDLAQIFWERAQREPHGMTGEYFDRTPERLLELLSGLALRANGLEEIKTATVSLEEAMIRLKEKRLKGDLQDFKKLGQIDQINLVHEKIRALSQVLKNKERVYGERKT